MPCHKHLGFLQVIVKKRWDGASVALTLLCGHIVIREPRPKWGRRTHCDKCLHEPAEPR